MDQITYQHTESASSKWAKMSVNLQMGNIGSEVSRAREKFCDYFFNNNSFHTDPAKMQRYYDQFVILNRKTL